MHHGANRMDSAGLARRAASADVVITTYGTAVRDVEAIEKIEWQRLVLDEAQAIKNPANETSQQLRRISAKTKVALTGTPIENGLGDLWSILDFTNPGLVGPRPRFIAGLSQEATNSKDGAEDAMRALNGILVFRRTKSEPAIAAELPDRIDELDRCSMTAEQIGLYQAVLDKLITGNSLELGEEPRKGQVLAAITALKQICNHPAAYQEDDRPLAGRSGKLSLKLDCALQVGDELLVAHACRRQVASQPAHHCVDGGALEMIGRTVGDQDGMHVVRTLSFDGGPWNSSRPRGSVSRTGPPWGPRDYGLAHRSVHVTSMRASSRRRSGRDSPMTFEGSPSMRSTKGAPSPSRVKPPATRRGSPVAM